MSEKPVPKDICGRQDPEFGARDPTDGRVIAQNSPPESIASVNVPLSPPKQVTIDQLAKMADNFYKMSLIHEISVDSNFKMEKPVVGNEEPIQKTIKETVHRAFWDVQRAHLNADPPNYAPALSLLKEIKQSLHSLTLPYQETLRAHIDARLDLESAEAQLSGTGKIDLESFAAPVIEMMTMWCAPVRDRDVTRLKDISDPIDFFQQTFSVLELMHMDLANFTIQNMRPYIRQQAGEYEREKFENLLQVQRNAGFDGLEITRGWIKSAYECLTEKAINRSPTASPDENTPLISSEPFPPTPNNILREAYLILLSWDNNRDFPETVAVDAIRIRELIDCLARTVTLASLVLVICNLVVINYASLVPAYLTNSASPQGSMTRLKEAVCRDVRGIVDGIPDYKIPELIGVLCTRVLFVVKSWRASLVKKAHGGEELPQVATTPLTEEKEEEKEAPPTHAVSTELPLPTPIEDQLSLLICDVLKKEHPVYKLMFSRALGFLRSALSARPPDPIPLPAGFGALSDSSPLFSTNAASPQTTSIPLDPSLCAFEKPVISRQCQDTDSPASLHVDMSRIYDLAMIASRLLPLVAHNRYVFGPYYAEIIQGLLAAAAPVHQSK